MLIPKRIHHFFLGGEKSSVQEAWPSKGHIPCQGPRNATSCMTAGQPHRRTWSVRLIRTWTTTNTELSWQKLKEIHFSLRFELLVWNLYNEIINNKFVQNPEQQTKDELEMSSDGRTLMMQVTVWGRHRKSRRLCCCRLCRTNDFRIVCKDVT